MARKAALRAESTAHARSRRAAAASSGTLARASVSARRRLASRKPSRDGEPHRRQRRVHARPRQRPRVGPPQRGVRLARPGRRLPLRARPPRVHEAARHRRRHGRVAALGGHAALGRERGQQRRRARVAPVGEPAAAAARRGPREAQGVHEAGSTRAARDIHAAYVRGRRSGA